MVTPILLFDTFRIFRDFSEKSKNQKDFEKIKKDFEKIKKAFERIKKDFQKNKKDFQKKGARTQEP